MHPLHEYIARQLAERLKSRSIVVWYDEASEFLPFHSELLRDARQDNGVAVVSLCSRDVVVACFSGSLFALRFLLEPHVCQDSPAEMVIYLPGCARDRAASVLMELEKAGTTWEPRLEHLARKVLLQVYTRGIVDELLTQDRRITYEDLARLSSGNSGDQEPSVLRTIFDEIRNPDALLPRWLTDRSRDEEILSKDASRELEKLVQHQIGLTLPPNTPLAKIRILTNKYVLVTGLRLEIQESPSCLEGIPLAPSEEARVAVTDILSRLRREFPIEYVSKSDEVAEELGLNGAEISAKLLHGANTFRFQEKLLLKYCGDLISDSRFDEALDLLERMGGNFWLQRDVARCAQWEACRRMAELGALAVKIRGVLPKTEAAPHVWVEAYTSKNGWYLLDQAQRRLEAWVARLDEDPSEIPLGVVRRAYEDSCHVMAERFTQALVRSGWSFSNLLHQTKIFEAFVSASPKPVAYFLVDAMRYEMGIELQERLQKICEVAIRPAVGALPSVTPVGMAALLPSAGGSFVVTEKGGKLGVQIEEAFLPDLSARRRFVSSRVPKAVDVTLDELLSAQPSRLKKKLDSASIVVVRSQEIDHAGEAGFSFQARQIMDSVIDNIARGIRKLATCGIDHAVISADHGHLFFPSDRDESMRTDPPGGQTVDLHRRCWVGRGGSTPPGCIRASSSSLGYASSLEFVFPAGSGVLRSGGDLAFHHGGVSLQEIVIPVITSRARSLEVRKTRNASVEVSGLPDLITNRIFSISVVTDGILFGTTKIAIRPLLMSSGRQVGTVGMVVDACLDRDTGCVTIEAGKIAGVVLILSDESASAVRVVIQDPNTDGELYRSQNDIPVRLGV